jgi:hypothetical protein
MVFQSVPNVTQPQYSLWLDFVLNAIAPDVHNPVHYRWRQHAGDSASRLYQHPACRVVDCLIFSKPENGV